MERCRLCGGRIVGGRCAECGLDNTKNDKKYRLNTHNQKGQMIHQGDCEKHLNVDPDKAVNKKRKTVYTNTGSRVSVGTNSGKPKSVGTNAGTQKNANTSAERRRELKKRRETGTVQRKKGKLWGVIFLLIVYLLPALVEWVEDAVDSVTDAFDNFGSYTQEIFWDEDKEVSLWDDIEAAPEREYWNEADPGYYETTLTPGFYMAGYEFPAGTYQFQCEEGSLWMNWKTPESVRWDYACLYSEADREWYRENFKEECRFFEYSEKVELPEGTWVFVNECENGVRMAGIGDGEDSMKQREPQTGLKEVPLESGMVAGKDFPAGIYDAVFEQEDAHVYLTVKEPGEYGDSIQVTVGMDGRNRIERIPFMEGCSVDLEYYTVRDGLKLVPSF